MAGCVIEAGGKIMHASLKALTFGMVFGGVMGLLYAPKSGARTRAKISLKAKAGKLFLKDQTEDIRETVAHAVERGSAVARRTAEVSRRVLA
jgi:gas vesicle protein